MVQRLTCLSCETHWSSSDTCTWYSRLKELLAISVQLNALSRNGIKISVIIKLAVCL